MTTWLVLVFALTYGAIVIEHTLKVNQSASAMVGAGLLWTIYALCLDNPPLVGAQLAQTVAGTAQIVLFLMCAMTLVEVIAAHDGFALITARIQTTRLSILMWQVGMVTFVLSALLDNLTTAIVMVTLVQKLLAQRSHRLLMAAIIVIAANAGGAWSPLGDVTTTLLWIGGQITAMRTIQGLFLPALVNLLIPLSILSWQSRHTTITAQTTPILDDGRVTSSYVTQHLVLWTGLGVLVAVPAFAYVTGLPPFMGMLLGLGLLSLAADLSHQHQPEVHQTRFALKTILTQIDMSCLLFFTGLLLSVAVLEHSHILASLAHGLDQTVGRMDVIVTLMGLLSALVDNVPLVAAIMAMYSLTNYPTDSFLWTFTAYCAGTGGSILIIGSAAGVAAMGLEKISFGWYFKNISALALAGYLTGAFVFVVQHA